MTRYAGRAAWVLDRCRQLARITDVPGETTRPFLSPATREAHAMLICWMREAGLDVRTDAMGNIRGVFSGPKPHSPRLLLGSHIDTVPNAGAYDGPLGVIIGLALVHELSATGRSLDFAVEIVAFSEEEGVRFSKPFLGSLALIGQLETEALALRDPAGISLGQAIADFGLDPAGLAQAADAGASAFLEFHIEQGPVLEQAHQPLGVVDTIVGQTRAELNFRGQANHAGTTPMGVFRRDALAAAAEWVTEVERHAGTTPGLVATVGKLEVYAGAGNVIPGHVVTTLDVRHAEDRARSISVQTLFETADRCGGRRGVTVDHAVKLDQNAVPMNPALTDSLARAVTRVTGQPAHRISSGAGHDAMILARRIPSAMLFLRSPRGLSHHPDESVLPGDVEAALAVGIEFLASLPL